MRRLGILIAVALASPTASAGPQSNPAFLGIGLRDSNRQTPCVVDSVTKGSGAHRAGLHIGDVFIKIDGVDVPHCQELQAAIVDHAPGDRLPVEIMRAFERITIQVTLSSRGEILSERFLGKQLDDPELVDIDDTKRSYELSEMRGRTTVLGWFVLDSCAKCSQLFARVDDELGKRRLVKQPYVLAAAVEGRKGPVRSYRAYFTAPTPLAVAIDPLASSNYALGDGDRVTFMVLDARGTVKFVTPIAADTDDLDAAVDEVVAAVEQAEHCSRRR